MGGSVKATPPDPALAEAQIKSLNSQAHLGERAMANAEAMAPTQMAQMQFGLDAARTGYEQTQADREYALGRRGQYDTAVDAVLKDSDKFDESVRRQELMAQAKADISTQFSGAQDQMTRGLNRAGVAPGSGKALLMQQSGELAEAAAKSRAGLMVTEAAKKEGLQLRGSNVEMLKGAPAAAASLTPAAANLGVMGLDTANTALTGMNQGFGEAGKQVGAYGQMAGDMWSNQNRLYTAAEAANDKSRSEMYGAATGLALGGAYKGASNYNWTGSAMDSTRKGTSQKNLWG
jgi:hypothetical protein